MPSRGRLFLIPVFLGPPYSRFLSSHLLQTVHHLRHFIVENEKSARAFLKAVATPVPMQEIRLSVLDEHTESVAIPDLLNPLLEGFDCGLMSEAGCPGVADPGSELVHWAHRKGIQVIPLAGPSSILLGLMASGLNGQQFRFNGYLSREKTERKNQLKELERTVLKNNETQLFIETPYRNVALFDDIVQTLHPDTLLCIACDINGLNERILTRKISEWKNQPVDFQKRPCIFLIGQQAQAITLKQPQQRISDRPRQQRRYRK